MNMIKICGMTEVGAVRKINQDNLFVDGVYKDKIEEQNCYYETEKKQEDTFVCAVFDGMGGLAAGEEASLKSVEYLSNYMCKVVQGGIAYDEETLITYINEKLCEWKEVRGVSMGSTIAVLYYCQGKIRACNLGDSRIYRYREKQLEQISVDHNEAASFKHFLRCGCPGQRRRYQSGKAGGYPQQHQGILPGLRHCAGRARRHRFRRPEAAHLHRPGPDEGCSHPHSG